MAEFLQDNLRVFVVPVDIMDIPDLNIYEQMVYIVLRSFANAREATAFPSYSTIAKLGRMSRRKAIDCVTALVEKGLLKKEVRLDVTKNRKIRNTSNLYTIESPRVVHSVHQGGAQRAPGVVHAVHQGGAQRAPENNHLTKPFRTNQLNNNKEEIVVEEPQNKIQELLFKYRIEVNQITIQKWKNICSEETILKTLEEVLKRNDIKNVVGYVTRILEAGFTPSQRSNRTKLPEYIQKKVFNEPNLIDEQQRKDALNLLFQLGEIEEQDYILQLKGLSNK